MTKQTFSAWRDLVEEAEAEAWIDKKNKEAVLISGDLNQTFYNGEVLE